MSLTTVAGRGYFYGMYLPGAEKVSMMICADGYIEQIVLVENITQPVRYTRYDLEVKYGKDGLIAEVQDWHTKEWCSTSLPDVLARRPLHPAASK